MLRLPTLLPLKPFSPIHLNPNPFPSHFHPLTNLSRHRHNHHLNPKPLLASSSSSSPPPPPPPNPTPNPNPNSPKPKSHHRHNKDDLTGDAAASTSSPTAFPVTKPPKPRRGRRGEAAAVEDFVRGRLEEVFATIRERNPEVLEGKGEILKQREDSEQDEQEKQEEEEEERKEVVDEEDPNWPLDADVGWGIRASEYFDKHPIKNVTVDGVEIDWEGEIDEGWVKEINCLEWESFAFHPSPLVVLVFERYKRAADNWKLLQELEKAAKVYWNAKDRLPPRTVKIDINIERDLAYALKVKECPQLLFLRGNKILYREKEMRTSDELVEMIAHFYYNAKRPSWVDAAAVAPPF